MRTIIAFLLLCSAAQGQVNLTQTKLFHQGWTQWEYRATVTFSDWVPDGSQSYLIHEPATDRDIDASGTIKIKYEQISELFNSIDYEITVRLYRVSPLQLDQIVWFGTGELIGDGAEDTINVSEILEGLTGYTEDGEDYRFIVNVKTQPFHADFSGSPDVLVGSGVLAGTQFTVKLLGM